MGAPVVAGSRGGRFRVYLTGAGAVLAVGVGVGVVLGQDGGAGQPATPAEVSPEVDDGAEELTDDVRDSEEVDDLGDTAEAGDGRDVTALQLTTGPLDWEVILEESAWAERRDRHMIQGLAQHDGTITAIGDGNGQVVAYTSTDGRNWARYPDEDRELATSISYIHAVTASEHGVLAAGTHRGVDHSHPTASVWISENGGWERIDDDPAFEAMHHTDVRGIADTSLGVVAVGAYGDPNDHQSAVAAAAWRSTDGHTWQSFSEPDVALGGPGDQYMNDVIGGGPGLIAVGVDGTPDADSRAAAWTHTEADGWERIPYDDPVFDGPGSLKMHAITRFEDGYVAVGQGGDGSAGVWTTANGEDWERVSDDLDNFEGGGTPIMFDVTDAGGQLVAVGIERFPDGHSTAAVWRSDDTRSWERLEHNPDVFDPGNLTVMKSVVAVENRIVVGGHYGDATGIDAPRHPAVWIAQ